MDFADDLAMLSNNHQQIQEETSTLNVTLESLGLKINEKKAKFSDVNSFTYQGSTIIEEGGVEECVKKQGKPVKPSWG
ncbi:hypothetical protein ElyMa_003216800 [Elysia marginata]|uniref:Reverse transcriptase domain-containing protein n=1 Tax=Elysia marginata TaxID=1093978 RepID=A0AAV4J3T1_9GAST|nr:hypothetical protein ElyMa_003216800 [Elysia marginata]